MILFSIRLFLLIDFNIDTFDAIANNTLNNKNAILIATIISNIIIISIFCTVNKIKKLRLLKFYDSKYTTFEKTLLIFFSFHVFDYFGLQFIKWIKNKNNFVWFIFCICNLFI